MKRVYVCHTFYHAYIACVKELLLRNGEPAADLVLSTMSNDFGEMPERLRDKGLFRSVLTFDEQSGENDEELQALHRDRGNFLGNLIQRIKYTKLLGKKQEAYIPVDFRSYDEVFVFCDSDPIGYYLNWKKIPYHALEDGLNCDKLDDMARLSNQGAFGLKAFLARRGLLFIPNGYSRYCLDYEVNDLSVNPLFPKNVFAVPRRELYERLSAEDHALLADVFLPENAGLQNLLKERKRPTAMILTEPLCEPDVRARLFGDIVRSYRDDYDVIIKPHPRDLLDYRALFGEEEDGPASAGKVLVLTGRFPMEVLDDIPGFRVAKLISVITQVDDARFADEVIYLGMDFLDRYEDPAVHRKMEKLIRESGNTPEPVPDKKDSAQAPENITVRLATPEDSAWWLEVRNDPEARRNSGTTERIDPAVHTGWFAARLADPDEKLFVFMKDDRRAGQLRLSARPVQDRAEDAAALSRPEEHTAGEVEISYAVAPEFRGQGVGRAMLETAKILAADAFPGSTLSGVVREDNTVSLHLFTSCGYREVARADGMVRFVI